MGRLETKHDRVARRVVGLIESGALRGGQRIPSVRAMARQTGYSIMTVLEGYRLLEDRGLVESRPQSGYFVRPELLRGRTVSLPPARAEPIRIVSRAIRITERVVGLLAQPTRSELLPLGMGVPSPEFFPSDALSLRMARAIRSSPNAANRYGLGPGDRRLREQLAVRMMEAGCEVGPDEILVTIGATEALQSCLRAIAAPGDTIAVESPGYFGFYAILEHLRIRAVEVPSDPDTGLSLAVLGRVLSGRDSVKGVVLCPTLSNPTGATMPDDAKRELAAMCRRAGAAIVEDDTYGELRFSGGRTRAVKSIDPENVVYVGSLSKVLAPGHRIGWVAGGRLHSAIGRHHVTTVISVPTVAQLGVGSFLADGGMARHLRRLRQRYADHAALYRHVIAEAFPEGTRVGEAEGGHFLWVELPRGCDSVALAEAAPTHGFTIAPGVLFSSRSHYRRFVRLNTAIPWSERLRGALETLGSLARRQAATIPFEATPPRAGTR